MRQESGLPICKEQSVQSIEFWNISNILNFYPILRVNIGPFIIENGAEILKFLFDHNLHKQ